MPSSQNTSADLFQQGVVALKAGHKERAADLLISALQRDPNHEQAWLWLSGAVQSNDERRECLERVLEINPHNTAAQRGLEKLGCTAPVLQPPAIAAPYQANLTVPAPMPSATMGTNPMTQTTVAPLPGAANGALGFMAAAAAPTDWSSHTALAAPPVAQPVVAPSTNEQVIQFVIEQFAKHRSRAEIARGLCEHYGVPWDQAEHYINSVQASHGRQIATRQAPFLIIIGVVTIIGGLGLFGYNSYRIYFMLNHYHVIPNPRSLMFAAGAVVTGLAMVLGAIIGMWQTIVAMFKS